MTTPKDVQILFLVETEAEIAETRETLAAMERQLACRMLYTGTLFSSSPRLDAVMVLRNVGHEEN